MLDLLTVLAAGNWKTTVLGIVFAFLMLWPDIQAIIDGDPKTMPDMTRVTMAMGLLGVSFVAKDGDKSSKSLGLK